MLHEKYPELDRIEDLLPLSLEIARLEDVGCAAQIQPPRRGSRGQSGRCRCIDPRRATSREEDPFEQASRRGTVARIEAALAEHLGERCRELFRLKLEGYTFPEIQDAAPVATLNTLYTWDFRCRKQLLERLGGSWEARRMTRDEIRRTDRGLCHRLAERGRA